MRNLWRIVTVCSLFWVLADATFGENKTTPRNPNVVGQFQLDVPAHPYDVILARPEKNSITLSVQAYQPAECYVTWGVRPDEKMGRSETVALAKEAPKEIVIKNLRPNTSYYYQLMGKKAGEKEFSPIQNGTFQTARSAGANFTFTLTADCHLDEHTSPNVYNQTLNNILFDHADFHIDLGNLFMTDKHTDRVEALRQYMAQRYYLGRLSTQTAVMLALGTHDGESSKYNDGTADSLAAWSNKLRTQLFPNPISDDFYTGNTSPTPPRWPSQNYYTLTWGDALIVVLDPFSYSTFQGRDKNGWGWSLGREQYDWLKATLERSRAKYKFVCIHNLLQGDQASRGGTEFASFNEWGGKNQDGSDGFAQHRPGWPMPVHQLLIKNHVAAVFRAHDNFYARQSLDGIIYLMVPQPSFAGNDRIRDLETYGYRNGVFKGNSGHIRVTVTPTQTTIDYIRAVTSSTRQSSARNGDVADSTIIKPF